MSNKIQPTDRFSVERGTDDELKRTLEIFESNGIKWQHNYPKLSDADITVFGIAWNGEYLNWYGSTCRVKDRLPTHYTASEFYTKYGERVYPFDLVGDAIQHDGKWWKLVSNEKAFFIEDGIHCRMADYSEISHATQEHVMHACIPKKLSLNKFIAENANYEYAWVEVDPPEPQVETISVAEAEKRFGIKIVVEVAK